MTRLPILALLLVLCTTAYGTDFPPPEPVGVDMELFLEVVGDLESGSVKHRCFAVSHQGAVGKYQILPSTAELYGYDLDDLGHEPLFDCDINRLWAMEILTDCYRRKRSVYLAAYCYHGGPWARVRINTRSHEYSRQATTNYGRLRIKNKPLIARNP